MIIEFVTQYQLAFTTLEEYWKVQIILRGSIIIATETYFERVGGLRGGCWSRDKSDARHYDPKAQFLLIKVAFIRLI